MHIGNLSAGVISESTAKIPPLPTQVMIGFVLFGKFQGCFVSQGLVGLTRFENACFSEIILLCVGLVVY